MKIVRWIIVALLIFSLVLVRAFEEELFYDPLLSYFHGDFINAEFPSFPIAKHLMSISLRYFLNAGISLAIIYFIFQEVRIVKFAGIVMLLFLLPFLALYAYFIHIEFQGFFTAGFYVRRFLLQPVLLLVLIPAIWFYQHQSTATVK